jgi:multidrug resistance efflux pump
MRTILKRGGRLLLPLLALALLGFAILHVVRSSQAAPELAPPLAPSRSPFEKAIAAIGVVEPQSENISIGSALPGVVLEVYVLVDQEVKQGTPLFRVDDRALQAQLKVQEANLAAAEAQLAKLEAMPREEELPPAEAKVKSAKADVDLYADQHLRHLKMLNYRPGTLSEEDYIKIQSSYEKSRHQLAQAEAEYTLLKAGAWKFDKSIASAAVAQNRAQVEQTRTEIERALVRAPVSGRVLQRNVRPGEFVGTPPSQALIVMGNVRPLHVRVDIDEPDIPRFQRGAPAQAAVRGAPDTCFPLTFVRVEPYVIPKKSLSGDNTERVDTRVLQVIFALGPNEDRVHVGQMLDVFLDGHPLPLDRRQTPAPITPTSHGK